MNLNDFYNLHSSYWLVLSTDYYMFSLARKHHGTSTLVSEDLRRWPIFLASSFSSGSVGAISNADIFHLEINPIFLPSAIELQSMNMSFVQCFRVAIDDSKSNEKWALTKTLTPSQHIQPIDPPSNFTYLDPPAKREDRGVSNPKIGGKQPPPNHPLKNRVWNHYFHHPFWDTITFGNTHS